MIDYRIRSLEGYKGKMGELVSMLEHTRAVTLADIMNLSQSELDYIPDETSNSIASLLQHIASIEFVHQVITFENRDLNKEELLIWETALGLGEKARAEIKGNPIVYYLNILTNIREKTLSELKSRGDSWLYEEGQFDGGGVFNNYWAWFHVMEDEINHRGQIRMLKRMLEKK